MGVLSGACSSPLAGQTQLPCHKTPPALQSQSPIPCRQAGRALQYGALPYTTMALAVHTALPFPGYAGAGDVAVSGRWVSEAYRYMSTVAMRWPPLEGRALYLSWKKSWWASYFCPST